MAQESLVIAGPLPRRFSAPLGRARHYDVLSIRATERKASGETRMAAPVGQARTQEGPPSIPEHMSHLIAFLA